MCSIGPRVVESIRGVKKPEPLCLPLPARVTRVSLPFQKGLPIRMPASLAASAPPLSPGEMQLLLSRAGLALNPGQVADLVLAWRQVAGLIASIPHDRPLADDFAFAFRLTPPVSAAEPPPARAPR